MSSQSLHFSPSFDAIPESGVMVCSKKTLKPLQTWLLGLSAMASLPLDTARKKPRLFEHPCKRCMRKLGVLLLIFTHAHNKIYEQQNDTAIFDTGGDITLI